MSCLQAQREETDPHEAILRPEPCETNFRRYPHTEKGRRQRGGIGRLNSLPKGGRKRKKMDGVGGGAKGLAGTLS